MLALFALTIAVIDPFFHYHAPLEGYAYSWLIADERYQNNGIVRNFTYDAVITGTSMTENFKASEVNDLFHVKAVKVPFSGAGYKEINDNLAVALGSNPDIRLVVWGLDLNSLAADKDAPFHGIADQGFRYPWYLIDENPFNDAEYLFNKTILLKGLEILKEPSKDNEIVFDEEYSWYGWNVFGKEAVLADYRRQDGKADFQREMTDEERKMTLENVKQNVSATVKENPDVEFYCFIPPYSICWWDNAERNGLINYYIEAMQTAMKELMKYENVRLFAFWNDYEMICDLNNYKDYVHYSEEVNSGILRRMAEEDESYLITENNYREYLKEIREFYTHYDYDSIFDYETTGE